jgi:hypothetical protein
MQRLLTMIAMPLLFVGMAFNANTAAKADVKKVRAPAAWVKGDNFGFSSDTSDLDANDPAALAEIPDVSNVEPELNEHQAYVLATASPGTTMTRQGPGLSIVRLHPEFSRRLAEAIREARASGLPQAGIYSAYRPPAFGIGGYADKFNSLHTYGLAVDLRDIGVPGSPETRLWREIAARHGIICPYAADNPVEWNHCQPTRVKIIHPENPLREQVTADGPVRLESMFEVGNALIEDIESTEAFFVEFDLLLHTVASQQNTISNAVTRRQAAAEASNAMASADSSRSAEAVSALAPMNVRKGQSSKSGPALSARVLQIMVEERTPDHARSRSGPATAARLGKPRPPVPARKYETGSPPAWS